MNEHMNVFPTEYVFLKGVYSCLTFQGSTYHRPCRTNCSYVQCSRTTQISTNMDTTILFLQPQARGHIVMLAPHKTLQLFSLTQKVRRNISMAGFVNRIRNVCFQVKGQKC